MSKSEIMIDNSVTRVTKWSFLPGEDTGQHIHHFDYVVVPIKDGKLKIIDKNGNETISELKQGVSYFREKGVNHNVINFNDFPFSFVEIEFK